MKNVLLLIMAISTICAVPAKYSFAAETAQATPSASATGDPETLIKKGLSMLKQGQTGAAETLLLNAADIALQKGDAKNRSIALAYLDKLYSATGERDKAVKNLSALSDMLAANPQQAAPLWIKTAELASDIADYETALKYFALARDFYSASGDAARVSRIDNGTAMALAGKSEFDAALKIYNALLDDARKRDNATDTISILFNMGDLERSRSDYPAAIKKYEDGLAIAKSKGRRRDQALLLNGVSLSWQYLAELDKAAAAANEALEKSRSENDARGEAAALHQLGVIRMHAGDIGSAIDNFKQSYDIKTRIGDASTGATLAELGRAFYFKGDYKNARKYYRDAAKSGLPAGEEITVSNNLAMVYKMQGMLDYALEIFDESLTKARSRALPYQEATLLNNIGVTLREKGNFDQALERHREALVINQRLGMKLDELISVNNMALAMMKKGQPQEALELLKTALESARAIGSYDDLVRTLVNMGDAHMDLKMPDEAIKFYNEAAETAEKISSRERLWNALFGKGEAMKSKGETDGSIAELKKSVKVIESLRDDIGGTADDRSSFLSDKVKVYRSLIEQLYTKGDYGAALDYLERMKSRSLLEMMRRGKGDVNRDMSPGEVAREKEMKANVQRAAKTLAKAIAESGPESTSARNAAAELAKARKDNDAFLAELYKKYPGLAFARGENEPMTHSDIMKLLAPGEAVVAYMLGPSTSYAWVMTKDKIVMRDLATAEEKIDFQVDKKLREAIEQRVWGGPQERAAKKLYEMVVAPLTADLEGATMVGILPDGRLYELPFYLLMDADGKFLIDRFAVYYMPSLSVMAEARRIRGGLKNEGTTLALGNPKFEREDLVQLPGTEAEVQEIAQIMGKKASVYFHEDALEARVKYFGGAYRIIHLASHGLLNNNNPMFSSIALSRPPDLKDDGYFEAREIANVKLNAEMVVMSACESGRGELQPGEGMLGLTRSFFSAGVPSVVASLWSVNDLATSFMMKKFYADLESMDPVEALRQAQIATRDNLDPNPNMWAPFVIMGSGPLAAK